MKRKTMEMILNVLVFLVLLRALQKYSAFQNYSLLAAIKPTAVRLKSIARAKSG